MVQTDVGPVELEPHFNSKVFEIISADFAVLETNGVGRPPPPPAWEKVQGDENGDDLLSGVFSQVHGGDEPLDGPLDQPRVSQQYTDESLRLHHRVHLLPVPLGLGVRVVSVVPPFPVDICTVVLRGCSGTTGPTPDAFPLPWKTRGVFLSAEHVVFV